MSWSFVRKGLISLHLRQIHNVPSDVGSPGRGWMWLRRSQGMLRALGCAFRNNPISNLKADSVAEK